MLFKLFRLLVLCSLSTLIIIYDFLLFVVVSILKNQFRLHAGFGKRQQGNDIKLLVKAGFLLMALMVCLAMTKECK